MSENGERVIEGKEHMYFKCYEQTCKILIKDGSPDSAFALCFLILQWNLISRSEAMENIFFKQVKWENDDLKIYFPKHKSDQIGLNQDEARQMKPDMFIPTPMIYLFVCYVHWYLICSSFNRFLLMVKIVPRKRSKEAFQYLLTQSNKI